MYSHQNKEVNDVSGLLDICNRYRGNFKEIQKQIIKMAEGGDLSVEGRTSHKNQLGEKQPSWMSNFSANNDVENKSKDLDRNLNPKDLMNEKNKDESKNSIMFSDMQSYSETAGAKNNVKSSFKNATTKHSGNPFDNSSQEDKLSRSRTLPLIQEKEPQEDFKELEKTNSCQTMEDLRHFILKEKSQLENEIVKLKLTLEQMSQESIKQKLLSEEQKRKIGKLQNENKEVKRQLKEYKDELYKRILNVTANSGGTGSLSVKRRNPLTLTTTNQIKKGNSFLSKKESSSSYKKDFNVNINDKIKGMDYLEKKSENFSPKNRRNNSYKLDRFKSSSKFDARNVTDYEARDAPGLNKKTLSNSKAFLTDFNKDISSILNRSSKIKTEPGQSQRKEQRKSYNLVSKDKDYHKMIGKVKSQSYFTDKQLGFEDTELPRTRLSRARMDRMANTLNLEGKSHFILTFDLFSGIL